MPSYLGVFIRRRRPKSNYVKFYCISKEKWFWFNCITLPTFLLKCTIEVDGNIVINVTYHEKKPYQHYRYLFATNTTTKEIQEIKKFTDKDYYIQATLHEKFEHKYKNKTNSLAYITIGEAIEDSLTFKLFQSEDFHVEYSIQYIFVLAFEEENIVCKDIIPYDECIQYV